MEDKKFNQEIFIQKHIGMFKDWDKKTDINIIRNTINTIKREAEKEMLKKQITLLEDMGKDNIEIYELKLLLEDLN